MSYLPFLLCLALSYTVPGAYSSNTTSSIDQSGSTSSIDQSGSTSSIDLSGSSLTGWISGKCSFWLMFCDPASLCQPGHAGNATYFRCYCPEGTTGDGYINGTGCTSNVTQCHHDDQCHQYAICDKTVNYCSCKPGFLGDGGHSCDDINECESNPCHEHARCDNYAGNYTCTCDIQNNYEGNGTFCEHRCNTERDCHPDAVCNTVERRCHCKPGYSGDGVNCTDIDECLVPEKCPPVSTCVNEIGSFRCDCNNGYFRKASNESCTAAPRDCEEIRMRGFNKFGFYQIDPDFTGPAKLFQVQCKFRGDYAVTTVLQQNHEEKLSTKGSYTIDYGTDFISLQALLTRSTFCYQETSLECRPKFQYTEDFVWTDAYNQTHTAWAGSSLEGMCGCGQLGKCDRCLCGNHTHKKTDKGLFVDKSRLPITFIRLPELYGSKVEIGYLYCARRVFDIPADCDGWKKTHKRNDAFYIYPEGSSADQPFLVYCDLESYPHVGVTEVQLQQNTIQMPSHQEVSLAYIQGLDNVHTLITTSAFCSQDVQYSCQNSGITGNRVFVKVTSDHRQLTYFPGANGLEDLCACGATRSCQDRSLRCDCDLLDGVQRRDFGSIINKTDLPVVAVTGGAGQGNSNSFFVSNLRCAPKQFGIQPNCEKLQGLAGFDLYPYTYFIDPDGPDVGRSATPNVDPFLVECRFRRSPAEGVTIIHHDLESGWQITGYTFLDYFHASHQQLHALLDRSTYCTQAVSIGCRKFALSFNGGESSWTAFDGKVTNFSTSLLSCTSDGQCNCDGSSSYNEDGGIFREKETLPIAALNFKDVISQLSTNPGAFANVSVGPLKCSELFPTCGKMVHFVRSRQDLGETLPDTESSVTIDPDGAGPLDAFEVQCSQTDTVVTIEREGDKLEVRGTEPRSQCFDIIYQDLEGNAISNEQLIALRNVSAHCFQTLSVECVNAKVHGKVNFTTCDGVTQVGWAGSIGHDSCACGVGGHCQGGPSFKCNCDLEDNEPRKDGSVIIRHDRLPVCQVCLSLDGIPAELASTITTRRLSFSVSKLNCHPGRGRNVEGASSCQVVRLRKDVQQERTVIVYMNRRSPIPVGCKLLRDPPVGLLEIFPQKQVHQGNFRTNITIQYYTTNLTILHVLMERHKYCAQRVYFFCLPSDTEVTFTGSDGWVDIEGNLRQSWDKLMDDEIDRSSVCEEFAYYCQLCGKPKGYVVYEKSSLPITGLLLSLNSNFTVVVESALCHDLFENCYEIMVDRTQMGNHAGRYTIDPDGAGGVEPFEVHCDFRNKPHCALTSVTPTARFKRAVKASPQSNANETKRAVSYFKTSVEQIVALANMSEVCWQSVQFDCQAAKLINNNNPAVSYYNLVDGVPSPSFGTGQLSDVIGCACNLTGTCGDDLTCHCDAGSSEPARDAGVVNNKADLPITEVTLGPHTTPQSSGVMKVGDVFCGNSYCFRFPRDCQQALDWKNKYGIDYTQSGEYFIQPRPDICDPFPVFCEMDIAKGIGVTRVVPRTREDTVLTPGERSEFDYHIPSTQELGCLINVSDHCFQPVAYECYRAKLLGGGVRGEDAEGNVFNTWGGGISGTCACGAKNRCGGLDSSDAQLQRKCNCDVMDARWRKDAGLLTDKNKLPVSAMNLTSLTPDPDSRVNLTLGDLYCGQKIFHFDECSTGFHDCAEQATCEDTADGYKCSCKPGWEGKDNARSQDRTLPVANGRECIDDNECSFNVCPLGKSVCINTPGSYYCVCNSGYTQTGPATCVDIDECTKGTHDCDVNAKCINQDGTYKCVCNRNYKGSGHKGDCHLIGICMIFGDPHTNSYDNRWNHYQGKPNCQYVASTDACQPGDNGTFTVLIRPWQKDPPRIGVGHFTWVKEVEIHVMGKVVEMLQNHVLFVDGTRTVGYNDLNLDIYESGRQQVLQATNGLEILWDGNDGLQIMASHSFSGKLCGLCGNMNGDPADDWMIGRACNGSDNVTDVETVFGDSWVGGDSDYPRCLPDCNATHDGGDGCAVDMGTAEKRCARLYDINQTPFKDCVLQLDTVFFVGLRQSCIFDLCRQGDDEDVICTHAEALVSECQINTRVPILDWRQPGFCAIQCPGNMTYMTCGPNPADPTVSQMSCSDVAAASGSGKGLTGCVEGCFCESGFVLDGPRCVKPKDCGCYHNGSYLPVGFTTGKSECGPVVECRPNGTLDNTVRHCGDHASCVPDSDGIRHCHCDTGFIGDGFTCTADPCYNVTCPANSELVGLRCQCKPGFKGDDCLTCEVSPCHNVQCPALSHCVAGKCQCKPGYVGECDACEDIDECKAQIHNCHGEGQICINTPGSFVCECDIGYIPKGNGCEDVDECALGSDHCPSHSECFNKPGMYACMCCVGYSLDGHGNCILRDPLDTQYIDLNSTATTCCSCNSPECDKPGMVCGTNGVTFPNIRSMVVQTCLEERRVHDMYEGSCQTSCSQVQCSWPYATCEELPGLATCKCPSCDPNQVIQISDAVCGSDLRLYRTECEFRAAMCVSNTHTITILPNSSQCLDFGGGGGAMTTTGWSNCSVPCGEGEVYRTLTSLSPPFQQFNVTAVCFATCTDSHACERFHCKGPGKECIMLASGPVCTCPLCGHVTHEPVCGEVAGKISTYRNLCELRSAACLQHVDFFLLDNAPCQAEPVDCAVAQNFLRRTDSNGCQNEVPYNYGRCAGGCGAYTDKCCYTSSVASRTVPFLCPDGSTIQKQEEVITGCTCVTPDVLNQLKGQFET